MNLLESIAAGNFTITVEFTPHSREDVVRIAAIAKALAALNEKYAPRNVRFAGISLTQNPGGNLSYDHLAALKILREEGFPESLDVCPHVTGKDMNADAVRSLLQALHESGMAAQVLALTGDMPTAARGVWEVDSLGVLGLVKEVNAGVLRKCKNQTAFDSARLLRAGAAVSPFKYTPASLAMQFIKARKKIRDGAEFIVCQSGWDVERSEQLLYELGRTGAPVLGNVLVVDKAAARYMKTLPGCMVSDEMLRSLEGKPPEEPLERAGRQMAMFQALGYSGADLARPGDFKSVVEIEKVVDTALDTPDWRRFKKQIHFPMPDSASPRVSRGAPCSRLVHEQVFERLGGFYEVTEALLKPFEKSREHDGFLYRLFNAAEGFGKGVLYRCEHCGDCYLPEDNFVCTMGSCEKGLPNPPCGDPDARGMCGNNPLIPCVAESLYYRMLVHGELDKFKAETRPPRDARLKDSASILNYFFKRDHRAARNPLQGGGLVQIGEMTHASIALPGAAMRHVLALGEDGFTKPNRGLDALADLIATQARQGADYLDINIDALNAPDAPGFMRGLVRLAHRFGGGVPPCIDSSNPAVLEAGLREWFELGGERPPLVNSIPYNESEKRRAILDLRRAHRFSVICLLIGGEGPLKSTGEMVSAALELFRTAKAAGFDDKEVFFDCVTLGISSDGCIDAEGNVKASHTHNSFNAMRQIKTHPEMRGARCVLGVSNWVHGTQKRRIGHLRAFIAVGMQYGLDAVIVDVEKRFGVEPAAAELMRFVRMFAELDGNEESMMTYSAMMREARQENWI